MDEDAKTVAESEAKKCSGMSKKCRIPHIGVVFGVISSLLYSLNAIFAKLVPISPLQIALSRFLVQTLILVPFLLRCDPRQLDYIAGKREVRIFLWIRGFSGALSGTFLYLGLQHLSAGSSVTLSFLDIIFVPILCRFFYREAFTIFDGVFALLAFCGVVLIARPSFLFTSLLNERSESPLGVAYAIFGALCGAVSLVTLRKMGKEVHFLHSVFYFSFVGLVLNSVLLSAFGEFQFPCVLELIYLLFMICSALLGLISVTLAVQNERPGIVAVLLTLQIIFVYGIQVVVLDDIPTTLSLVGAGMIFFTSVCIGIRKVVNERRRKLMKDGE